MPRRASLPEGKSLFYRPPAPGQSATEAPELPAHTPTRQSAIFLEERHLDWLDDKCREARHNGGRAIRKAIIIRTLLDIAMSSPIDLTGLRHEDDLLQRIESGLRGRQGE